ncbi:uroporphyrinogen-III synthase [Sphingomonas turrisvirgatae]|uniref:Tetrapyrrole biosynthesis uroporphyrinogen III synthase domain-containing protein n=1 Tax=Sphingomonas turrisvirgatae TaxID=1888892 RepID=A0A1E3LQ95_9SPHN|nr:uroporphyrinogen-III synthase [Sphingomonas turrisvirgatae]ODP35939.1 hypothetical protein BFL28_07545 [Sphingomonas turrisvirgatae]
MIRPVAVLRPEPGNAATVARVRDAGLSGIALPLFEIEPVDWSPPAPDRFDGLLLTSANALRQGGVGLAALHALPVLAVGAATAAAARDHGFAVERIGERDVRSMLADVAPVRRLLWLAGEHRTRIDHPSIAQTLTLYRAAPRRCDHAALAPLAGSVALIHSTRAAQQLLTAIDAAGMARGTIRLVAISDKAAHAAGPGWEAVAVSRAPTDPALIDAARALAIDP